MLFLMKRMKIDEAYKCEMLELLLEHGVDPNVIDNQGRSMGPGRGRGGVGLEVFSAFLRL